MNRVVARTQDLKNAEAVLAVGDEGEGAGGDHANFYIVDVAELAFGGENLIEFGRIRFFNVDDREALLSCRDVSVSARNVNVAGIFEGDESAADWFWSREIGDVKNLQAVTIDDKGVPELHGDPATIVGSERADVGGDARDERIVEVDHDESFVGEDVSEGAGDGDAARSRQDAVGIEGDGALQEIIGGSCVEGRRQPRGFYFQICTAG